MEGAIELKHTYYVLAYYKHSSNSSSGETSTVGPWKSLYPQTQYHNDATAMKPTKTTQE